MPFDPARPHDHATIEADELRNQFNGLDDKIADIPAGPPGPQGPPFANAVVDAVTTLAPGSSATVNVSFDGTNVHFTIAIPAGADGTNGANGTNGSDGAPGEVTNAALAAAIADTARNPAGIGAFPGTFSDPPTQAEMQAFAAYVETLRAALAR